MEVITKLRFRVLKGPDSRAMFGSERSLSFLIAVSHLPSGNSNGNRYEPSRLVLHTIFGGVKWLWEWRVQLLQSRPKSLSSDIVARSLCDCDCFAVATIYYDCDCDRRCSRRGRGRGYSLIPRQARLSRCISVQCLVKKQDGTIIRGTEVCVKPDQIGRNAESSCQTCDVLLVLGRTLASSGLIARQMNENKDICLVT